MSLQDLPLWATTGPSPELVARLRTLATELLERAGAHGVGFDEVRMAAETRGWLTGHEMGRFLSCGDGVMRGARGKRGFVARYRRSLHKNSQRRRVAVHVHERFREASVA